MRSQPTLYGTPQVLQLCWRDGFFRMSVGVRQTRFHFDKSENVIAFHDKINFTKTTTPILRNHTKSFYAQKRRRVCLSTAPDLLSAIPHIHYFRCFGFGNHFSYASRAADSFLFLGKITKICRQICQPQAAKEPTQSTRKNRVLKSGIRSHVNAYKRSPTRPNQINKAQKERIGLRISFASDRRGTFTNHNAPTTVTATFPYSRRASTTRENGMGERENQKEKVRRGGIEESWNTDHAS